MRYSELIEARAPNAAWFAGSKVVDESGAPMVVYHGSFANFAKFAPGYENGMTKPRMGFYFTDHLDAAKEFGNVHGYYLAIKRPADFRDDGGQDFVDRALATDPELRDQYRQVVEDRYGPGVTVSRLQRMGLLQRDRFLAALIKIGCDGMFMEDDFMGHDFQSYIAFKPEQIRKVTRKPIPAASSF